MLGVCITVVGVVRLIETSHTVTTIIDNIVAIDSMLFLAAALMSYLAVRNGARRWRLERYADIAFLVALSVLAIAGLMLAFEIG